MGANTTAISSSDDGGLRVEAVARELADLFQAEANTRTIFGEPIQLETRKIIPVAMIEIGAGGGGGFGQGAVDAVRGIIETAKKLIPTGSGVGDAGALAIKVRPIGFLCEENGIVVFTAIATR
jgi:uncharacterized spore protein YtfJ